MYVGTETISGQECEVHVNGKTGSWEILSPDGESLARGMARETAVNAARTRLAKLKVRVDVPFIAHNGERGAATGIHGAHNGILARMEDGTSVVINRYDESHPLSPETPPSEIHRYVELTEQARQAKIEAERIARQYEFDLRRAVEAAVAEAQKAQVAQ